MNWEPTAIYKMRKENNQVIFTKNSDGRFLVSDHKESKSTFMNTKQARKLWKEYLRKGYTKV